MDKPAGCTSHDVVALARRRYRLRAVGHTGTLDPFATGLLVLLFGPATRLARFVESAPKTYRATARLGVCTSTDDLTGEVVAGGAAAPAPDEAAVREALRALAGVQRQRPPVYSAKRVAGERSYRRARRGEAVELPEVEVVVHRISLIGYRFPDLEFRCTVSAGTYVRALARDLGERLGTGAHLTALRREAIGALRVEEAIGLDRLGPETPLGSPLAVLPHLPRVEVGEDAARALGFGRAVERPEPGLVPAPDGASPASRAVAVLRGERLVAICEARGAILQPVVVLERPEG
ncbi:MAG TPA: tRNA pseudouridine(55) synthase TruB [Gemmatimonadales bacterium]|nr:tRNA pseudouridine(55) synthase TruB [Gemmatimonadales bacterium]